MNVVWFFPKSVAVWFCTAAIWWISGLFSAWANQSVTLAWDRNPETDIQGYRLHYGTKSGTYIQQVDVGNATTTTLTHLAEAPAYYYVITAYSAAGLESLPSNEAVFRWPNDGPVVTWSNPISGAAFNVPTSVSLEANASDADGSVTKVEFYVDGVKAGEDTAPPFTVYWTPRNLGTHHLEVVAQDNLGATSRAAATVKTYQLSITNFRFLPDRSCELTIIGAPGRTNQVWVSEDLQSWTPLKTVENREGAVTIHDPDARRFKQRFYKVSSD